MSQLQVTGEAKIRDIQGPVVANSGVITALDGAASQYVRGDGTLADFPTSTGGGSSVSYYLNSSVSQGTIGGVAYRELSKEPIIGAGTDITISANGYVASYITDANDPDVLSVPGGNFNCEFYFSVNNNTGNPTTYAELYKYDGTTFTLLGSSQAVPESLNQGTTIAPYYFAIPVATAALALTDRLAIRIYVNVDGRVVTLHTENSHLCQVVTTFSKGMVSLNNLTDQSQFITTGTSGTNFNIVSTGDTHTFNLPVASATNTGKLSSTDWSTFNNKLSTATAAATYVPYTGATTNVDLGFFNFDANQINGFKIIAKLDGTNSGSLILRTGTSGYSYGNDSISLISSPTSANTLTIVSDVSLVTKIAQIGLGSLTATRTFTLPDASGTLALTSNLSSYVPYTGATSNVNLGVYDISVSGIKVESNVSGGTAVNIKQNSTTLIAGAGYISIGAKDLDTLLFQYGGATNSDYKVIRLKTTNIPNTTSRAYEFPNADGTIALTSNLSSYLPLAGGTLTGALNGTSAAFSSFVSAFSFTAIGGTSNAGQISLKHTGAISVGDGYVTIAADSSNTLGIYFFNSFSAKFSISALTNNRTYTLPDGTGTLALTSNLSAYLPLTGGTLTGNLTLNSSSLLRLGNSDNASTMQIWNSQSGGINNLLIYDNAANAYRFVIGNTGNVAIGTGSIVDFGSTNTTLAVNNVNGGGGGGSFVCMSDGNQGLRMSVDSASSALWEPRNVNLRIATNNTERMRISSNGNVGIGTNTIPNTLGQGTLQIGTTSNFININDQTYIQNNWYYNAGTPTYIKTGFASRFLMSTDGSFIFTNTTSGTANTPIGTEFERMRITSGGDVGIGNSGFASTRLTVSGKDNTSSNYAFVANNASNSNLFLVRNDGLVIVNTNDILMSQARSISIDLDSTPFGGSAKYWRLNSNAANGTFRVLQITNGGGMYLDPNNPSGGWIGISDMRLKNDLGFIEDGALDKIMNLKPRRFTFKTQDENAAPSVGFFAQEIMEYLPETITEIEEEEEEVLTYNANFVIPYLVKAIQELKAEIEILKNK